MSDAIVPALHVGDIGMDQHIGGEVETLFFSHSTIWPHSSA